MRILIVTPYLPHAAVSHGGGRVVHELIRELGRSHEVGLLSFVASDEEAAIAEQLESSLFELRTVRHDVQHIGKLRRLANLPSLEPSATLHVSNAAFGQALSEMTEAGRYEIVQLSYPWMACYLDRIGGGVPVMDLIECFGRHWRGRVGRDRLGPAAPYLLWDWWRGERFELRALPRFRRVFVLTDEDRDWLLARRPDLPVRTRRVGVDRVEAATADGPRDSLLFVGSFSHPANRDGLVWFLDEVFPLVRASKPELTIRVAGSPAPTDLAHRPGVDVLGFVDDLGPLYARALACISPIRYGGGVKTKGLEAMAHGAPLVTTSLGAEGYPAQDGRDIEIADSPQDFADRILALADDPERAQRLGAAGRELVRTRNDWDLLLDELLQDYATLVREAGA